MMDSLQTSDPQLAGFLDKARSVAREIEPFGKSVLFDFGELGKVFADASSDPVTFEHGAKFERRASCMVKTKLSVLQKLVDGKLDPMMAIFSGRLKISGEMDAALELAKRLKAANV